MAACPAGSRRSASAEEHDARSVRLHRVGVIASIAAARTSAYARGLERGAATRRTAPGRTGSRRAHRGSVTPTSTSSSSTSTSTSPAAVAAAFIERGRAEERRRVRLELVVPAGGDHPCVRATASTASRFALRERVRVHRREHCAAGPDDPRELDEPADRFGEVIEHERSDRRRRSGRRRTAVCITSATTAGGRRCAVPSEHVVREVDADDRRDAGGAQWRLADAGTRTDVEHASAGEGEGPTRDELRRDRRVDERRALRPALGRGRGSGRGSRARRRVRIGDVARAAHARRPPTSAARRRRPSPSPTRSTRSCRAGTGRVGGRTSRSCCTPRRSSASRSASIVASFAIGSRALFSARYHAEIPQTGPDPGYAQSSRIVRPSRWRPRLPIFQSPCRNVAGVERIASAERAGRGVDRGEQLGERGRALREPRPALRPRPGSAPGGSSTAASAAMLSGAKNRDAFLERRQTDVVGPIPSTGPRARRDRRSDRDDRRARSSRRLPGTGGRRCRA